jgi:hypothetical protein
MRYALVAPRTNISGTPYVAFKGNVPIRKSLQKETPKMSYYGVSTNILDTDDIELLRVLAKKWKATLPAEIAESEQPKEPTKDE